MNSRSRLLSALALITLLLTVGGLGAALADSGDDDRIRQRVEARLVGQVAVHIESFGIEVQDGIVHLTGIVDSLGERNRADRVVGGIVGVRGIRNDLQLRASDRSEQAISQEISRRLDSRTRFRKTPVQVTVAGTEVTLAGAVERALDRLDAEEIAADVPGVTKINNTLQVRSEGSVTPEAIRSRVTSILTNPLTFGVIRNLQVSVEQGTVTISGSAAREADRLQAERLTLGVPGVVGVINLITLG